MIIGSITTMPHRIQDCKPVIESILSTGIECLEFNIPEKSLRTGEEYIIPSWLTEMENVQIFRTPDYGPLTKVLPTMQRHENKSGWIISFDDDTLYKSDLVKLYTPFLTETNVIGPLGFDVTPRSKDLIHPINGPCSILYGYPSIMYPMNLYKTSDMEYFTEVLKDKNCFQSDDVTLSNFAYRKNCPCLLVIGLKEAIVDQLISGIQDPLALMNTGKTNSIKMFSAIDYLKKKNLLSLPGFPQIKKYGFQGGQLKIS